MRRRKYLKEIVAVSIVGMCVIFAMMFFVAGEDITGVEVLFAPEQGEEILAELTEAIQAAEERIYILIYSFTLDELARVLIDKHEQGIDVRVIMDRVQASSKSAVTETLSQAGIPLLIKTGSKGGYMHIKVLIADDVILTGSYNWSANATYRSDENFLVIRNKDVVKAHLRKFERLWTSERQK